MVLREQIEIFGDGKQLRDPVFVDDAVAVFLLLGAAESLPSRVYNVGGPEVVSVEDIARRASEIASCPEPAFRPFPADRKPIDIGSYATDGRRIEADFGWRAQTELAEGLRRTLAFFRSELPQYLDPAHPNPPCRMPEHTGSRRGLKYVSLTAGID
jgi:UDP-glucose 4-epimerase